MNNQTDEKIYSLMDAYNGIQHAIENCRLNHKDPFDVPFIIREDWHKYKVYSTFIGCGRNGFVAGIEFYKEDEIKVIAPDVRPEGGGEYWSSRGPSSFDVSGFVKSKKAGERLLRFVKYVLEKDETETWLDYREHEPEWIQFKFSANEFDVVKLDKLSCENNGILTEDIIKECVLKDEEKEKKMAD